MKKFLLFTLLLIAVSDIFAFTHQGNWRWRNDDGSQTTATWKAAQNAAPVITSTTELIRLRVELFNNPANAGGFLDGAIIEDSSNIPGDVWKKITLVPAATDPFSLAGTSPNVTNFEATTQQLTSPHVPNYQPGQVIVSSEELPSGTVVVANTTTEFEYVLKPTAAMLPSTIYYFRINAAEYLPDIPMPSLSTAGVLPVTLVNFSINKEGQHIKLQWSTSSEINNQRFDIERNSKSGLWSTIGSVPGKGKGNMDQPQQYDFTDADPLNGINYYRLKQVDIDGQFNYSEVKSIKFNPTSKIGLTLAPNPTRGNINFKLENKKASNVLVTLSNANGKVVYQETFKNIQADNINKLNLKQQPPAGIYILKLQADGLSESRKLIIQ